MIMNAGFPRLKLILGIWRNQMGKIEGLLGDPFQQNRRHQNKRGVGRAESGRHEYLPEEDAMKNAPTMKSASRNARISKRLSAIIPLPSLAPAHLYRRRFQSFGKGLCHEDQ